MTGPPTAADVAVVPGVEVMAGVGVVTAGVVTGALVPVEEPHAVMSRPAARASTDLRMTPSSGEREQALRLARSA
jgi:hypothetical protein